MSERRLNYSVLFVFSPRYTFKKEPEAKENTPRNVKQFQLSRYRKVLSLGADGDSERFSLASRELRSTFSFPSKPNLKNKTIQGRLGGSVS